MWSWIETARASFIYCVGVESAQSNCTAMASYKLTYLNYRGRAELIRFILSQAGLQFEDCRIPPEKWPERRPTTPLGVLPLLEFEDKTLSGNGAIARYLAEKHGLAGSNDFENAKIFSLVEVTEDLWVRIAQIFWNKDEQKKQELKKEFKESYLPLALAKLEKRTAENNSPEGWVCGTKALLSDAPTILDNFPTLAKLKTSVEQLPNIAKWLKERPTTPY